MFSIFFIYKQIFDIEMRKLRGGKREESRKEKQERKKLNREIKSQFNSVVLPTILAIAAVIILFVYLKTRPQSL